MMYAKWEKVRRSGLKVLDVADLSIQLGLTVESARVIATRMVRRGILSRLKRDLYLLNEVEINRFEVANHLISPSYVSFESALNYWGITTQIPETITSAALRSKTFSILEKEFSFSRLPENLFKFGFLKEGTFFIAGPEKALLDMIYYASLGKKSVTFDLLDVGKINRTRFFGTLKKFPGRTKELAKEVLK